MKTKRILSIILMSVMLIVCLVGCGADEGTFDAENDINVVSREDGSGTRGAFVELFGIEEKSADGSKTDKTTKEAIIANKTDVMLTNVSGDTYAIGYVSLGSLSDSVKALKIDGAEATADNVKKGIYKVSRPFNIATKGELSDLTADFIDFILSAEGQEIVAQSYIAVNEDAPSYKGTKPNGKIVVSGSSSVSPIMEKLKEAYLTVNPGAKIEIQTNDSTSGITSTIDGTCDIGMASRELKQSEMDEGLASTVIALDGIAIIVNPANTLDNLSADQVKSIFTGETTVWSDVH